MADQRALWEPASAPYGGITSDRKRAEAIARANRALGMFVVEGIHISIPIHQRILTDPDFIAGRFDTTFVNRFLPAPKG